MEQTIKNMELVLEKVESEAGSETPQTCKTLMNTYRTILTSISNDRLYAVKNENNLISMIDTFEKQYIKINSLREIFEKLISHSLRDGNFKTADHLAETVKRLEISSLSVNDLLNRLKNWKVSVESEK